jgi:hypothetical protein
VCDWDDDFTGNNGDPAGANWEYVSPATINDFDIQSNKLRARTGTCSDCVRRIQSKGWPNVRAATGDFLITCDFDVTGNPSSNSWFFGLFIIPFGGGTEIGVWVSYNSGNDRYRVDNGPGTNDYARSSDTGKIRLKRTDDDVDIDYWNGSAWVNLETVLNWSSDDVFLRFDNQSWTNNPTATCYWDNLNIVWGCGAGTPAPTTPVPTTAAPTTLAPTTLAPTTVAPTTVAPTTVAPTTLAPTTLAPTTPTPTTVAPTTAEPSTLTPSTSPPTTVAPTTVAPTTAPPTSIPPTTVSVSTVVPTTLAPTTSAPTSAAVTTVAPTTSAPTTLLTTVAPTTLVPTTTVLSEEVISKVIDELELLSPILSEVSLDSTIFMEPELLSPILD